MNNSTKNNIFSGNELGKLQDFCKQCAEEDKKIHEQRKNNSGQYMESPQESSPPESEPKSQSYNPPQNSYENQPKETTNKTQYTYVEGGVKKNVLGEDDPFNARIKFDTFDQRLKQFGNK